MARVAFTIGADAVGDDLERGVPAESLALTAEVREVRGGTRDICKVVSAPKGEAYVGA